MKLILLSAFFGSLFFSVVTPAQTQDTCPIGNFNACGEMLRNLHSGNQGTEFTRKFDEVCAANKKFKCIKKIVRGDLNDELTYLSKEHKKARLFKVKLESEDYIYILEPK